MKRLARVLLMGCWVGGCAPPPSSVPLGLGPLALAEREAIAAEKLASPGSGAERPARAAARDSAVAESRASGEAADEADADDDADEPGSGEGDDGEAGEPAEVAELEGLYAGEDVAIFRLSGLPEREQKDPKAQIRIERDSATQVRITLINSEDGSDLCELSARVEGNAALLTSPQPCFTSDEEGAIQAELTSARAVVSGERLTMEAEGTLSVVLGEQELSGDLEYSFEGERQ